MQIGVHALVFTGTFDQAGISAAVERTARAGFDLIEFPLMDPFAFDREHAAREIASHGIAATASLGLSEQTDLTSPDPAVREAGETLLAECLDIVHALGSTELCGVLYSAMKKYVTPPTSEGRAASAAAIGRLADKAAGLGITLSLEVVNRYETNLLNTGRQALRFLEDVDRDNVRVHLDTYHMNIEESDLVQPVLDVSERLGYVHIGESHRGYLGSGTVDFDAFFRGLARIDYDGPVVFESFSSTVVSETLSNTLGVWRNLWDDGDDLAAHANRFIRDRLRSVETIALH
ncbi:sugar phosphate isomerase/epimerase family protein [Labedella endophytica]|uniref:Sugar phosphate isomerase/epimerase n=1 Tax=Labedella endophytica TaxID=1523160 RepID=A0A433JU43_9MICO|nr:sugar phosphate isomerase/epimerase [Labedella endophytica]RUR01687.1 sugar phosphate isomerase/epimerase [Labedella endophytica]